MLKNRLLECDVPSGQIDVVPDEQEATGMALRAAQAGDLLLVLGDNIKRTWKQIIYFNSDARGESGRQKSSIRIDLPASGAFSLDESLEIISDERGVRIAREAGD
jgi:cyanophycin synthetase